MNAPSSAGIRMAPARSEDLDRYIALLEEVAEWLTARGVEQWSPGIFRNHSLYYAESIRRDEVFLAIFGKALAGTLRLLPNDPVVWPDLDQDDAVYVYNLAVRRTWAGHGLGRLMLDWALSRAAALGRRYVRLDCFAHNEFLSNYYRCEGFEDRGVVDAGYPDPVGTLRLRRFEKSV